MDECFIRHVRQGSEGAEGLTAAGHARIKTIIGCSKAYDEDLHTILVSKLANDPSLTVKCLRYCVSSYTSLTNVNRFLKRKGDVKTEHYASPKRRRSSGDTQFSFFTAVFFCDNECNVHKSRKNPGRLRKAFIFRQNESSQSGKDMSSFC